MAKMDALRDMIQAELLQKKNELLDERFNLRMRRSMKALDNPLRLRLIRREVAQINTILNEDKLNIRKLADKTTSILSESDSPAKGDKGK
jgi:large subunit ribosomal protein L29